MGVGVNLEAKDAEDTGCEYKTMDMSKVAGMKNRQYLRFIANRCCCKGIIFTNDYEYSCFAVIHSMKSNSHIIIGSYFAILIIGIASLIWGLAEAKKSVILIEWSTANEIDTVGFNLYRSENPEFQYEQVNASLIPSLNDPLTGGNYQFEDENVTPGKTYYYRLEDVETNGGSTQHGPIEVKAQSKGQPFMIIGSILFVIGLVCLITQKIPAIKIKDN